MDTRYNGWRSYETWLAKLRMDNDGTDLAKMAEEHLRQARDNSPDGDAETIRRDAGESFATMLESMHDEAAEQIDAKGFFADAINATLREVDWREIADNVLDDIPLWVAGLNMPGYMPDSTPSVFMDWSDAREYLLEELDRTNEDAETPDPAVDEYADSLRNLKSDYDAEIGQTIQSYHYWISKA